MSLRSKKWKMRENDTRLPTQAFRFYNMMIYKHSVREILVIHLSIKNSNQEYIQICYNSTSKKDNSMKNS